MIDGVKTKNLEFRCDERGRLIEILRSDDEIFEKFGQVYMTTAYSGVIKAWHAHRHQDDNIACIKGMIKLVIYDDRTGSPTYQKYDEFLIGESNSQLIHIPLLIWHGFKNIGSDEALVINIPTKPYNHQKPDELRKALSEISYDWSK